MNDNLPLELTQEEESALKGEQGEIMQMAYRILVATGEATDAEKLIPIKWAHLSGVNYNTIGDAGEEFLSTISKEARVTVKTTLNPMGFDIDNVSNYKIDENFISNCFFLTASGEELPYQDETFDLVTIGFGLRNFTDKNKGLNEMHRCLKPNGHLLVLEFSKPSNSLFEKVYDWYSFNILPKMGKFFAHDEQSYQYLAESIRMHPDQENLKHMILNEGFKKCDFYNFQNGIVSIHKAIK